MFNRLMIYVLSLWYLVLFQVYPIVHLHWHEDGALEMCFIAVEYNRTDHVIRHESGETTRAKHQHNHSKEHWVETCETTYHPGALSECAEQCQHVHVNADFDHFVAKDKNGRNDSEPVNGLVVDFSLSPTPISHTLYPQPFVVGTDFFKSIPSNKSPPRC